MKNTGGIRGKRPRMAHVDGIRMGANWQKLAKEIGVSTEQLKSWRADPTAPTLPRKLAWRDYRDEHASAPGAVLSRAEAGPMAPRLTLRDEKTAAEIKLLDARLAREQRRVVPLTDIVSLLTRLSTQVKLQLYELLETEAPPKLAGRDAAGIRVTLREMADQICAALSANTESWLRDEEQTEQKNE